MALNCNRRLDLPFQGEPILEKVYIVFAALTRGLEKESKLFGISPQNV